MGAANRRWLRIVAAILAVANGVCVVLWLLGRSVNLGVQGLLILAVIGMTNLMQRNPRDRR